MFQETAILQAAGEALSETSCPGEIWATSRGSQQSMMSAGTSTEAVGKRNNAQYFMMDNDVRIGDSPGVELWEGPEYADKYNSELDGTEGASELAEFLGYGQSETRLSTEAPQYLSWSSCEPHVGQGDPSTVGQSEQAPMDLLDNNNVPYLEYGTPCEGYPSKWERNGKHGPPSSLESPTTTSRPPMAGLVHLDPIEVWRRASG